MKEISIPEQQSHLVEEVRAIIAQRKFNAGTELLQMRHEIGKAILESPLYRKHGKGQGELLKGIAEQVGLQERSLRYCVEFAQKWPDVGNALQSSDPQHKLPVWRDIVRELPSGRHDGPQRQPTCKHCPEHCPT